jgi:hypothetical protein
MSRAAELGEGGMMTEDPRMRLTLHDRGIIPEPDGDLRATLKSRIEAAKFDYDHALDRRSQLHALARMARLKAALAAIEA